jgi:hypothetical protein
MQHYARDGVNPSAGLRAAPDTYAALAERALHWTGDLWSALQQAAERRAALRPAASEALELVAHYFEQPDGWPTVDKALWEPARLCVPACFALQVAERFVRATRPPLARFGTDRAHAFHVELLGPAVTASLAEKAKQRMAALLPALPATSDVPRDTPVLNLCEPPVFDAGLRAMWRQALAAGASATSAKAATPPLPTGVLADWQARLAGTRLHASLDSLRDSDYSGGGYYSTRERTLELRRDGEFLWRETSHLRVSAGGLSGTTTTYDDRHGRWKLSLLRQQPQLELHDSEGRISLMSLVDGGIRTVLLDGNAYATNR